MRRSQATEPRRMSRAVPASCRRRPLKHLRLGHLLWAALGVQPSPIQDSGLAISSRQCRGCRFRRSRIQIQDPGRPWPIYVGNKKMGGVRGTQGIDKINVYSQLGIIPSAMSRAMELPERVLDRRRGDGGSLPPVHGAGRTPSVLRRGRRRESGAPSAAWTGATKSSRKISTFEFCGSGRSSTMRQLAHLCLATRIGRQMHQGDQ